MLDEVVNRTIERPVRLFRKTLRFLHLFSGRRREGDLAHQLFVEGQKRGILVLTDNYDTVISEDFDLCNLERVLELLAKIETGYYAGAHAGPPCNTWSIALYRRPGPCVVRDAASPWGFSDLTSWKDILRMEIGSWLVLVALACLRSVARIQGSASLEHPRQKGDKVASIWPLPEVANLEKERTAFGFTRVDLDMCRKNIRFK